MYNKPLYWVLVLWVMPPLGFLITVLQLQSLRYVVSNSAVLLILLLAIFLQLQMCPVSRRSLMWIVLAVTLIIALLSIEWFHVLAGRQALDGLNDLRMIVYSPFYGSLIVFVLYCIYLTCLGDGEKRSHLEFVVRILSFFHLFFLSYWFLLKFGWVDTIPRTSLLHSNWVSYEALFVLYILLLFRDALHLGKLSYGLFIVINTVVVLVNNSRGAILGLAFVAIYLIITRSNPKRWALNLIFVTCLGAILGLGVLTSNEVGGFFLGRDGGALETVMDYISDAYERGETTIVAPPIVSDEGSLSAFSRIGSSYYSLLSFLDNPLFGIGQTASYAIKIFGSGVHSLLFLMANATGITGLTLFVAVLVAILSAQGTFVVSHRLVLMIFLFFGYVLYFENSLPAYFSLVIALLPAERDGSSHLGSQRVRFL